MSVNKERYAEFCRNADHMPIFNQDWWLDAVCSPENWDVVLVEKGGRIQGALPFFFKSRFGRRWITMPPLTQTMGPYLNYPNGQKYEKRLAFEKDVVGQLIEALPPVLSYHQHLSPALTNWLPYYWRGYHASPRITYIIPDLRDLDTVWDGTRANIRTDVRKAREQVTVVEDGDLEILLHLNRMTFQRQDRSLPYDADLVRHIDAECKKRDCGRLFLARGEDERWHAGIYVVWNRHSAHYILGGGDPELRSSGATSLLIWQAIQFAAEVSQKFDFEGSMLPGVERFCRAFGAHQVPYLSIRRTHSRLLHFIQSLRKGLSGQV